ncbi:MAG: selenium-dependent molybdenum cofactor biosynthesis protein YqeB [Cellulosilyticaceae bacterium]
MLILIKGAGDLASGVAYRLKMAGFDIIMTETSIPTTVRRTVAFSPCVYNEHATVEHLHAHLAHTPEEAMKIVKADSIPVLIDPDGNIAKLLPFDVIVDAIIAKKNLSTTINDAPVVIALGPGFEAGKDCHCVVETKRGHTLGRALYEGHAIPNTGVPGNIGGYSHERLIKAPCGGVFHGIVSIGDVVKKDTILAMVNTTPVIAQIDGVVRGLLQDDVPVCQNMKIGDIDPRLVTDYCNTVSDKALAIGGGVLEAILYLSRRNAHA